MYIFEKGNDLYVYIHIPKNHGTYIRSRIYDNYNVIQSFWGIFNHRDFAHLPYLFRKKFIEQSKVIKERKTRFPNQTIQYITFIRNPYDRVISAFFHLHRADLARRPNREKYFIDFVEHELINYKFNDYNSDYIHYYPQYKFVIDQNGKIGSDITFYKSDQYHNQELVFPDTWIVRKYNLKQYYTQHTLDIVNQLYAKDFEIFNYPQVLTLPK